MKSLVYLLLFLSFSMQSFALTETERIRSHLALVEKLLRQQNTDHLNQQQKENRSRGLDHLHYYWNRGLFPQNIGHQGSRHPYFIDHLGVPCAVAYLIQTSGHEALATQLSYRFNNSYLEEMSDFELENWIFQSGFTLEELRLIQPSYAYQPVSDDPFVEAAFLGDFPKVQKFIEEGLNDFDGFTAQQRLNEALRKVAPVAEAKSESASSEIKKSRHSKSKVRRDPPMLWHQPTPFKGRGMDVLKLLLKNKADPNDHSLCRQTVLGELQGSYLALDPKFSSNAVVEVLKQHGAQLSKSDLLFQALRGNYFGEFHKILSELKPGVSLPAQGPPIFSELLSRANQLPKTKYLRESSEPIDIMLLAFARSKVIPEETCSQLQRGKVGFSPLMDIVYRSPRFEILEEFISLGYKPGSQNEIDSLFERWSMSRILSSREVAQLGSGRIEFIDLHIKSIKPTPQAYARIFKVLSDAQPLRTIEILAKLGMKFTNSDLDALLSSWRFREKGNWGEKSEILNMFKQNLAGVIPSASAYVYLNERIWADDQDGVSYLLTNWLNINYNLDNSICPPLATAIQSNNKEIVRYLLLKKADPNLTWNKSIGNCKGQVITTSNQQQKIRDMEMSPEIASLFKK